MQVSHGIALQSQGHQTPKQAPRMCNAHFDSRGNGCASLPHRHCTAHNRTLLKSRDHQHLHVLTNRLLRCCKTRTSSCGFNERDGKGIRHMSRGAAHDCEDCRSRGGGHSRKKEKADIDDPRRSGPTAQGRPCQTGEWSLTVVMIRYLCSP